MTTRLLFCLLALVLAAGCRAHDPSPTAPGEDPRLRVPGGAGLRLVFAPPPGAGAPPLGASLWAGSQRHRLGPRNGWSAVLGPPLAPPFLLRIDPFGGGPEFHPLRRVVVEADPWSLEMPLLRRTPLGGTPYAELLDLLQEFLEPWSGSRVSRWESLPQRVRLPALPPDDPYRTTCLEAIDVWNVTMGRTVLEAVSSTDSATIRCTVFEEDRAAFTRSEARDADGHPLRLRVHLSRRWIEDAPRYIRRIWVHELGHALGLWGHSRDLDHVVNGRAVITDRPHPHELAALELLFRLPRDFDLSWIRRSWPPPRSPRPSPAALPDVQCPPEHVLDGAVPGAEVPREIGHRAEGSKGEHRPR